MVSVNCLCPQCCLFWHFGFVNIVVAIQITNPLEEHGANNPKAPSKKKKKKKKISFREDTICDVKTKAVAVEFKEKYGVGRRQSLDKLRDIQ